MVTTESETLSEARRLFELGFGILWLKPHSKAPIGKGWTKRKQESWKDLRKNWKPGFNVGVRLGAASKLNGMYLAVLDVDIKSEDRADRDEAYKVLVDEFPEIKSAPKVLSGRGGDSAHFYFLMEEPYRGNSVTYHSRKKVRVKMPSVEPTDKEREILTPVELEKGIRIRRAWEIQLMGEGKQVVLPPSIHPDSGKSYRWARPLEAVSQIPELVLPFEAFTAENAEQLAEDIGKSTLPKGYKFQDVDPNTLGLRPDQLKILVEGVDEDGDRIENRSNHMFALSMAMMQRGATDDTVVSVLTDKRFYLGKTPYEEKKHAGTLNNRRIAAEWVMNFTVKKARKKVAAGNMLFDVVPEPAPDKGGGPGKDHSKNNQTTESVEDDNWRKQLHKDKHGNTSSSIHNLALILEKESGKPTFIRRDEFSLFDRWTVSTPWRCKKGVIRSPGEDDSLRIKKWLLDSYRMETPLSRIKETLSMVAVHNGHHPLRDYLGKLKWDGIPRIREAFKRYLGADMPEPYLSEVCELFFMGAVARAFEPGTMFQHSIVLEGNQGKGKSTFLQTLASKPWYLPNLPSMQDKDALVLLQGAWICELRELSAIMKTGNETVKSFIDRDEDKFRPPYGTGWGTYPRTVVFVGTTNENFYLQDRTGGRRFWPVWMNQCDFDAVAKDRDQLWAEAVEMWYFNRRPLWLEGKALAQAKRLQENRRFEDTTDLLSEAFKQWISSENKKGGTKSTSILDLFRTGPFSEFPMTRPNQMAVSSVLKENGFVKKHTVKGNIWILQ